MTGPVTDTWVQYADFWGPWMRRFFIGSAICGLVIIALLVAILVAIIRK